MTRKDRRPPIERALSVCEPAVSFTRLLSEERERLQQLWRETFARRVKSITGNWIHEGFDWHAFSYEFVFCRQRAKAVAEYQTRKASSFLVLPHLDEEPGYSCESKQLPALHGLDAYVIDPGFTWTMVFTHEEDLCGPYFTTPEWAADRQPVQSRRGGRRR